ncbi:hypothetical protein [Bradyrhizobium liaoningense]|uniref:hypothetical protein n=1 Tax=Bradyrhizobium liaoningense TaxID=43992 RepID=UPI001BAB9211|nr:hypothetical protein [Bradyrhizobium liaoningense]MBR1171379.1 hypothetical protein [Bradyrhizobium liaoningense]
MNKSVNGLQGVGVAARSPREANRRNNTQMTGNKLAAALAGRFNTPVHRAWVASGSHAISWAKAQRTAASFWIHSWLQALPLNALP